MITVITYGTYDVLHYGHIRLLERAKALGDYLIVGVTSDDYDKTRGKINNKQSLTERVEAVKATGIADKVIVEEYDGQKIDDIRKYGADIFTVGSDWEGKFDYLNDYCKVIYLPRTEGVSSTEIRSKENSLRIGIYGDVFSDLTSPSKFVRENAFVNGAEVLCANTHIEGISFVEDLSEIVSKVDAVYIASNPANHYKDVKYALENGKHVLCESPITLRKDETCELFELAKKMNCVLMEAIKTAYTTAFWRMVLLCKAGKIGEVLSVDATCTSINRTIQFGSGDKVDSWNTITEWGPLPLLAIFSILGCDYENISISSRMHPKMKAFDLFTKIDLQYKNSVASLKVAKGAKSEGDLIVTGTDGYIYVPAPWWKTDYFEIRYENPADNKRYFYQLNGEGIRYEIVAFIKAIENGSSDFYISEHISATISKVMEKFFTGNNIHII